MSTMTFEAIPVQWTALQAFEEIEPINDADLECLAEVREVLKKYGKRERFGVTLLHKHFDIAEDEILVETTDVEARLLTTKPMKKDCVGNTVETTWMLLDGENRAMLGCRTVCSPNIHGNHHPFHQST